MLHKLFRAMTSIALGIALALPFVRIVPFVAHAQSGLGGFDDGYGPLTSEQLLPEAAAQYTGLGNTDIRVAIAQIIRIALSFLGIIAIVITLYGGFKWMIAGGNDEKVGEAKRILVAGLIGLAIILTAFAITQFVISSIIAATQTGASAL